MGATITFHTNSFTIDLGGINPDRSMARIKLDAIRSITKCTDGDSVEVVFRDGEIQGFPHQVIDDIDGDTNISSQDILYSKLEAKIFV